MPFLHNLPTDETIIFSYLDDLIDTIVYKDIITRFQIRNIAFYQKLLEYLAQNIGTIFSANSLSKYFKSLDLKIGANQIIEYINYATQAYIIHEVQRYDIRGKELFANRSKYYFNDIGIRNAIVGGIKPESIPGILENLVFVHLKMAGWQVYVGEYGGKEIDFVAEKNGQKQYFQVTYLLASKETIEREYSAYA